MQYGEHTALVEEVIDFAFSGRVLFATGPAEETEEAWITNDLRLAVEANAGEEGISRFRMAPEVDVAGWGNTELLGHNLASGGDLRVDDAAEDLFWTWHDLTENLVAELIWTTEWHRSPVQQRFHNLLFAKFIRSPLEKELRRHLDDILPPARPLEGWGKCAEHLANNMVSELWYCAENRAFNGRPDNFWERMFRLYQRGVWACGWRGFYPCPGKFIAYRRP
jgi:hypothetical protein